TSYSEGKPVQMVPRVKIQKDVNSMKKLDTRSVGEDLMKNLTRVSLHITGRCGQGCGICPGGYRQFVCCTTERNKKKELEPAEISNLLDEISGIPFLTLDILGGNIFKYSDFKNFAAKVNHFPADIKYHAHYADIIGEIDKLRLLNPNSSMVKVLVPSPINPEQLKAAMDVLQGTPLEAECIFVVASEEEFEKAEAVISALGIGAHEYQPFFDGGNLEFFKENVFTTTEEILEAKPSMKDHYARSVVNGHNFGRLTILSNGHIYANVNASRLGILGKDSLYDVLYKEMYHGRSWRRIRRNVEPCKRCTFETMCPPLSNYSYAIGRNNLCHKGMESP
ncbi:MAG: TIGR04150 pseudo-rSAM protein, partial [bacterium]|nr:TIGR04150 pseudo-rSAM protein [bacterium]